MKLLHSNFPFILNQGTNLVSNSVSVWSAILGSVKNIHAIISSVMHINVKNLLHVPTEAIKKNKISINNMFIYKNWVHNVKVSYVIIRKTWKKHFKQFCEIWGSHGGEYEDGCHHDPDDGGSKDVGIICGKDLWKVGKLLPDDTALKPDDSHLHFKQLFSVDYPYVF
jgi:hypothetical protein